MSLNSRYFELLTSEIDGDVKYCIYRPKVSNMVLFSTKDGTPLASLALKPISNDSALISERPDSVDDSVQRFQGLCKNDNEEFSLVITNLNTDGYINFNILKTDEKVTNTNPGGLNEINELRPLESYAVRCDQSNNLQLILSSIKNESGETLTIKEDEDVAKKTGKSTKGTYYYLSVTPEVGIDGLGDRFSETTWKCVDLISIKEKYVKSSDTPFSFMAPNHNQNPWFVNEAYDMNANYAPYRAYGGARDNARSLFRNQNQEMAAPADLDYGLEIDSDSDEEEMGFDMDFNSVYKSTNDSTSFSIGRKSKKKNLLKVSNHIGVNTIGSSLKSASHDIRGEIQNPKNVISPWMQSTSQAHDIILDSKASSIKYGEKITVNSAQTDKVYDYDNSSCPCVIGLSVSEQINFNIHPSRELLLEEATNLLKRIHDNKYVDFLKEKIYSTGVCSICTDEDDGPPDTVFYQCGHKAVHYNCLSQDLKKCLLCRKLIGAYLKLTTDNVDEVVDKDVVNKTHLINEQKTNVSVAC